MFAHNDEELAVIVLDRVLRKRLKHDSGMKNFARLLAMSLAFFSLSACGKYKMPEYQYDYNPNPKQRYEITLVVNDAPGDFDSIVGSAYYEVLDKSCAPVVDSINGIRYRPEQIVKFNHSRISENEYKGVIYADLIKNEDYFGLGVCEWSFTSGGFELTASNGMVFSATVMHRELRDGFEKKFYFLNEQFSEITASDFPKFATSKNDPSGFSEQKRNDVFSISVKIKEDQG